MKVADALKDYINAVPDLLSAHTASSTRATGDAIESLVAEKFDSFLGGWCKEYSSDFARRAMADVAFKDMAAEGGCLGVGGIHALLTKQR